MGASQPAAAHRGHAELQTGLHVSAIHEFAHPTLDGAHRGAHALADGAVGEAGIHEHEDLALLDIKVDLVDTAHLAGYEVCSRLPCALEERERESDKAAGVQQQSAGRLILAVSCRWHHGDGAVDDDHPCRQLARDAHLKPALDRAAHCFEHAGRLESRSLEHVAVADAPLACQFLLDVLVAVDRHDVAFDEHEHLAAGTALQLVEPVAHRLASAHDVHDVRFARAGVAIELLQREHLGLGLPQPVFVIEDERAQGDIGGCGDEMAAVGALPRHETAIAERGDRGGNLRWPQTEVGADVIGRARAVSHEVLVHAVLDDPEPQHIQSHHTLHSAARAVHRLRERASTSSHGAYTTPYANDAVAQLCQEPIHSHEKVTHMSPHPRRTAFGVTVAVTAMLGTLLVPASAFATALPDASEVLASTTAAERRALAAATSLAAPDEIHVADGVDLSSDTVAEYVVLLRQPVPATARALAALDGESLSQKDAEKAVAASQKRLQAAAKKQGLKVMQRYEDALNAVVVRAKGSELAGLLAAPDVASIWPNETIAVSLPAGDAETGLTGGGATYDEVAALHADGVDGRGVKVGVLDTGIDYNHPALKDAYRGGYDAVDGDDDPMESTYADWKASGRPEKVRGATYYTSHGTHVAGIIAGQDDTFGGRSAYGIAPGADIYGYRVLGPYGGGSTEDILEGMERALADGMDVVNMSLGGSYNDHRSPLSVAADNLTLAGVITVIAAGNDGEAGAATLGSPGTSALAITVGANDSPLTLATVQASVAHAAADLRLIAQKRDDASITSLAGQTFDLVDVGDGTATGYKGKVVTGKFVLIQRGTATFTDMVAGARNRGAAGAIVVNNREEGPIDVFLGESDSYVPMFGTTASDGAALRAALTEGSGEVTFGALDSIVTDADRLAGFSSRGPANGTTDIKPEITAPGVSVMSSVPTWDVDPKAEIPYSEAYGRKSGTSMATPFVSGLVALMVQEEPGLAPADVKTRLMNTADDLRDDSGVFESGAGQVDPRQAIAGTVDAQVIDELWMPAQRGSAAMDDITGALSLGMLPSRSSSTVSRTIEVTNRGSASQTYALTYDTEHGAGTGDIAESGIRVDLPSQVKVGAGKTKKVTVTVTVPEGVADGTYGAFVAVAVPGEKEPLRLPLGLRIDDAEISDFTTIKPVMTTSTDSFDPALKFSVGVATPTRTLDLFLADAETGEDIGYLGGIDPLLMRDGLRYGPFAWYGDYLPLTGDKNFPIGHKTVTVAPGAHILHLVGTDDSGTEFSRTVDFYVDTTAPTFTTAFDESTVNEFRQGQSGFTLTGSLVDPDVEAIRAAGIDIDQSDNLVQLFSANIMPYKAVHPATDGTVSTDITLLPSAVQSHRFLGTDAAGNIGRRVESMWFRESQPYVLGATDARVAAPGEQVTMSFTTRNADRFGQMRVEAYFNPRDTRVVKAVAQDAFAEYGRISGDMTITKTSASVSKLSVPVVFDGPKEYTGDDLPLIDLVFEVPDTIAAATTGFATVSTYVTRTDGSTPQMQRYFDTVEALAPTSRVTGGMYAQGLLGPDGALNPDIDLTAADVDATVTAADGTAAELHVSADGALDVGGLPVREEPWRLKITVPGHLTWNQPLDLAATAADGRSTGTTVSILPMLTAGDVNSDDVVDILDAIAVRDARGSANRSADIDLSGTVDSADLAFIERNFLVRNPTADEVPTPRMSHRGVTLDEVLAAFGG